MVELSICARTLFYSLNNTNLNYEHWKVACPYILFIFLNFWFFVFSPQFVCFIIFIESRSKLVRLTIGLFSFRNRTVSVHFQVIKMDVENTIANWWEPNEFEIMLALFFRSIYMHIVLFSVPKNEIQLQMHFRLFVDVFILFSLLFVAMK